MTEACVVLDDPWQVERRLAELDLSSEELREAVRAGLLERQACTGYDPLSAPGYELWRLSSRRLREVKIVGPSPDWEPVDERGQPLVVNPVKGIAVTVSSGCEQTGNGDPAHPPRSKNPKGQVTTDLVAVNRQMLLFPGHPRAIRTPKAKERSTWFLLIHVDGSTAKCELSLPRAMSDGHIVDWHERLMLEPVTLDEIPKALGLDPDGGDSSDIDVPVSRKRGA